MTGDTSGTPIHPQDECAGCICRKGQVDRIGDTFLPKPIYRKQEVLFELKWGQMTLKHHIPNLTRSTMS